MQLTIFALIIAICQMKNPRLKIVMTEMEVPGDTSNDTCMFEKSEEPHDTQIELDPFAVSTKCT